MVENIKDSAGDLAGVIDRVTKSNSPINLRAENGDEVKVMPVPKPISFWKGRPVFNVEDAKYMYLECPWLLE